MVQMYHSFTVLIYVLHNVLLYFGEKIKVDFFSLLALEYSHILMRLRIDPDAENLPISSKTNSFTFSKSVIVV